MASTSAPRALAGRRIALTRPAGAAAGWRAQLEALGAEVLELPLIQVSREIDKHTLHDVLSELGGYDWIVFTSANGVRFFFEEFRRIFDDIRSLGLLRIAVVGEATAAAVRELWLKVECQPKKAAAEALADELIASGSLDSARILVITGNLNRDTLVTKLEEARAIVDCLQVYKTEETDLAADPVARDFRARGADAILFASPSAAQSFLDQAAALKLEPKARRPVAGSIGPSTTAAMKEMKLPVDFEAAEPSLESLVEALGKKLENR
ncbi:MAG TPA: uroporphyrinogen-III synthase [Opitutaceae bacterium]|nr:uroporphyrinogen-III synthase [Opitutaceae bacterium]